MEKQISRKTAPELLREAGVGEEVIAAECASL